jgi:hypothetical protein
MPKPTLSKVNSFILLAVLKLGVSVVAFFGVLMPRAYSLDG